MRAYQCLLVPVPQRGRRLQEHICRLYAMFESPTAIGVKNYLPVENAYTVVPASVRGGAVIIDVYAFASWRV